MSEQEEKKYVCCDCGHTQDEMTSCARCGGLRTVLLSFIVEHFGPEWRKNFEDGQ